MDVTIVYEGTLGNTRSVAEAIAAGAQDLHPCIRVHVLTTSTWPRDGVIRPDLLIAGGPAHALRESTPASRHQGARPGTRRVSISAAAGVDHPRAREWLHALGRPRDGSGAAAFDTRPAFSLSGGTARQIARGLRRNGYPLVAHSAAFVVEGAYGPLRAGEEARAKAWGTELVRRAVYQRALHKANPVPACHR
jgi:hypothetical protein